MGYNDLPGDDGQPDEEAILLEEYDLDISGVYVPYYAVVAVGVRSRMEQGSGRERFA